MSLLRSSLRSIPRNLKPYPRLTGRRAMASTTGKYEWVVIIPDHEGVLDKRMEVRPKHFEGLKSGFESGFWRMGGAILEEVPREDGKLKIEGSAMVAYASSKEEVLETLKRDIYADSGVWDFSKIQIYPFKCAFRLPTDEVKQ